MFTSIKTSKINKDIVTDLSRKFNLGAENIIARIALTYSLSKDRKLSLSDIADSQGKEYSKNVLFGSNLPYYIGLICVKYGLYKTDKDIPKYIKLDTIGVGHFETFQYGLFYIVPSPRVVDVQSKIAGQIIRMSDVLEYQAYIF